MKEGRLVWLNTKAWKIKCLELTVASQNIFTIQHNNYKKFFFKVILLLINYNWNNSNTTLHYIILYIILLHALCVKSRVGAFFTVIDDFFWSQMLEWSSIIPSSDVLEIWRGASSALSEPFATRVALSPELEDLIKESKTIKWNTYTDEIQ